MFPDGVLYVALANVELKPFSNSLLSQFLQCGVGGSSHYVTIFFPLNAFDVFAFLSFFTIIETSQGQDFVLLGGAYLLPTTVTCV